jgi:MFS transporter, PAT family, beta-lactamase induction signal transducer AmpG
VTPYLSANRPLRLTTLCVLYVSQGVPDGFVRTGLKTYLIAQGVSIEDIANLIALVSWPWAIKWIWGPVIDRFSHSSLGRRRPWILAAQFGMGLTMGSMLLLPNLAASIPLLGMMILMINCFSSLQDVAIDAMAIDLLPEKERGVANGLMFGSSYIGSFLGGAVVGGFLLMYGVREAVMLEIFILVLIALFPLFLRERRGDKLFPGRRSDSLPEGGVEANKTIWGTLLQLKGAFARRSSILAGALAICSLATTSAFLVFWPVHMLRQLGWTSEKYLTLEGRYAILFGLLGSLLGGVLASWLGAKRSVITALASLSLCWLLYAATADTWDNKNLVTALFLAVTFLAGLFQVSMFALFMGVCSPVIAATQFSAYMALLNVSSSFGSKFAGYVGEQKELTNVFIGLACFQLAMIPIVSLIDISKTTPIDELPEAPNKA